MCSQNKVLLLGCKQGSPVMDQASSSEDWTSGDESVDSGTITSSVNEPHNFSSRFQTDFLYKGYLGQGSFGCVLKAKHKMDLQYFAVKRIEFEKQENLDKEIAEVQMLAGLNHRSIVRYVTSWMEQPPPGWQEEMDRTYRDLSVSSTVSSSGSTGSTGMYLYIQMELCQRKTLRDKIDSRDLGDFTQKAAMFRNILQGVAYIHSRNPKLMHRDLKPANILFSSKGDVKLGDFGLAKQLVDQEHTTNVGTLNYRSPEQLAGRSYDHKVDVYALGIILFEVFHPPFKTGSERIEVLHKLKEVQPKFPTSFKQEFPNICSLAEQMLIHKVDARIEAHTAEDYIQDILNPAGDNPRDDPNPGDDPDNLRDNTSDVHNDSGIMDITTELTPGRQNGASPDRQEAAAPGRQEVAAPGRQEAAAPGRQEGAAPGRQEVAAPGRQEAAAPGRQEVAALGRQEGAALGRQEGAAPGRQEVAAPDRQEGAAPGRQEGAAPGRQEVAAPDNTRGRVMSNIDSLLQSLHISEEEDEKTQSEHSNDGESDLIERDDWDKIGLRTYQLELAVDALEGHNVIISAPTGSGKTIIAMHITRNHLENEVENRVIFLAPNNPLVKQQKDLFATFLHNVKMVTGRAQEGKVTDLDRIVDKYKVTLMTPQILYDALRNGAVSFGQLSLLIIDECHRTYGDHPYSHIMNIYRDEKLRSKRVPQVVGLTASIGVGKSNKMEKAFRHIMSVMANLDAETNVCRVEQHKEDLNDFVNHAKQATIETQPRAVDLFKANIVHMMEKIHRIMMEIDKATVVPPDELDSHLYTNWVHDRKNDILNTKSGSEHEMLSSAIEYLVAYHDSLLVNEDCTSHQAHEFLLTAFQDKQQGHFSGELDRRLYALFKSIENALTSNDTENPKLMALKEVLKEEHSKKPDFCCLVFVKTRAMTDCMVGWMTEDEQLKGLNPGRLTGTGQKTDAGGMTYSHQEELLKLFREGRHQVVFSTSIGEEGLDIPICNLVISYEYASNEIAMMQKRGRGRAKNSRFILITSAKKLTSEQEEKNKEKEGLMEEALEYISQIPVERLRTKLRLLQKAERKDRMKKIERKEQEKSEKNMRRLSAPVYRILCMRCNAQVCTSSEVRIAQGMHRIIVKDDLRKRLKIKRSAKGGYRMHETVHHLGVADCRCGKPNCKVGNVMKLDQAPVLVLSLDNVNIETADGERVRRKSKFRWKDVPFQCQEIETSDIPDYALIGVE